MEGCAECVVRELRARGLLQSVLLEPTLAPTSAGLGELAALEPEACEEIALSALNAPGRWEVFIGHSRRSAKAELLATEIWAE